MLNLVNGGLDYTCRGLVIGDKAQLNGRIGCHVIRNPEHISTPLTITAVGPFDKFPSRGAVVDVNFQKIGVGVVAHIVGVPTLIGQNRIGHAGHVHRRCAQRGTSAIHIFRVWVIAGGKGIPGVGTAAPAGGCVAARLNDGCNGTRGNIRWNRCANFPNPRNRIVGGPSNEPSGILGGIFDIQIVSVLESHQVIEPKTWAGAEIGKGRIGAAGCAGKILKTNKISHNGSPGLRRDDPAVAVPCSSGQGYGIAGA